MKESSNASIQVATALVFLPANARLNFETTNQSPPETKYNKRMKQFDQDAVKKVVGGNYGRQDN